MRIKLIVSYDGTDYCGWQIQPNKNTIQGLLEKAIKKVTGEKNITVTGSGRTDAGVHAWGQVAHFDTQSSVPPEKFYKAINTFLPENVRVRESSLVDDSFDARKSAKKKTYRYTVYTGGVIEPLKDRYATFIEKLPNVENMQCVAKLFLGEHDFKSFCASGSSVKTTVRTIYAIDVVKEKDQIEFYVTGNGFLYNMVRTLIGTLIAAGNGEKDRAQIEKLLETGDRKLCGKTLSAKGLCLMKVDYQ